MTKATIFDVAARAGVSNATVSRALNTPDLVKVETRKKILKAAKELGYKANALARGLASSKSTQVAVIVSDLARASVAEMVKGILSVASTYKYSTIIIQSPTDDKYNDLLTDIVSSRVDGVLYLVDEMTDIKYNVLKELTDTYKVPLVLVNTLSRDTDDEKFLSVTIDYEEAGYEVTKALISEGRKNIALFTTLKRYPVSILKENGYVKAMIESSLEPKICYTSGNLDTNQTDIRNFLNNNKVDGIIGVRDSIAIASMNYLMEQGYKVPDDVSIYGFQNTRYDLLCRPNISTVDVPTNEIGARAMKELTIEMLEEERNTVEKRIMLKHRIIERESTLKKD